MGGCIPSDDWVVAMANGLIVRADNGAVVQDLDGDGNVSERLSLDIEGNPRVLGTSVDMGAYEVN